MEFTAALSSGKFKSSFEQSVREGKKEKKDGIGLQWVTDILALQIIESFLALLEHSLLTSDDTSRCDIYWETWPHGISFFW